MRNLIFFSALPYPLVWSLYLRQNVDWVVCLLAFFLFLWLVGTWAQVKYGDYFSLFCANVLSFGFSYFMMKTMVLLEMGMIWLRTRDFVGRYEVPEWGFWRNCFIMLFFQFVLLWLSKKVKQKRRA